MLHVYNSTSEEEKTSSKLNIAPINNVLSSKKNVVITTYPMKNKDSNNLNSVEVTESNKKIL